jgi:hypothetical protein
MAFMNSLGRSINSGVIAVEALIDQPETCADAVIDACMKTMPLGVVGGCLEGELQLVYLVAYGYKALLYVVHGVPTLSMVLVTLDA